ncbi:MAG: PilZ domain-containing protein, partial [Acidithiobacillus sp.]
LVAEEHYRRVLLFVESSGSILMGLSAFKCRHQGNDSFSPPALLYRRRTRQDRRVRIDGQILLRHRDGRTIVAHLNDFSPSGASFYADQLFPVGETLLAEFEVLDCGTCETVVTTAREERLPSGGPYRYLVGVKMQLTAAQRKKAEQLYLCKKPRP